MRHVFRATKIGWNEDQEGVWFDSDQYTKEAEMEQKAKSSLTYPKILSVLIVAVVAILFGYVLPQFEEMFA